MSTRRERAKEPTSKLNKQLAEMEIAEKMTRERQNKDLRYAEVYTNLANLVFGGIIIGGVFEEIDHPVSLYVIGIVVFLMLMRIGNRYYNRGIKEI